MEARLTIKEQIQVLKNIDWGVVENGNIGLCGAISNSFCEIYNSDVSYAGLKLIIPLFTIDNAYKFGAKRVIYWWRFAEEDIIKRREFINWIISELEKQLKLTL